MRCDFPRVARVAILLVAELSLLGVGLFADPLTDMPAQADQWRLLCQCALFAIPAAIVALSFRPDWRELLALSARWAVIAVGCAESCVALAQLYGFECSNHTLYKLTGTFYNPGPLGGYLAVCVPLALRESLRNASALWRGVSLCALALMAVVLLPSMSRTGWLAAAVGSLYVWLCCGGRERCARWLRSVSPWWLCAGGVAIAAALVGLWQMKSASAWGRLFLWRMGWDAACAHPWAGSGAFGPAYAEAQEAYFASGLGKDWEVAVAEAPVFAFNEYLDLAVRVGIPAALAIVAVVAALWLMAHRRSLVGECGAILALAIFASASYPFHIVAFVSVAALMVLTVASSVSRLLPLSLSAAATILCACALPAQGERVAAMRQWGDVRMLYELKSYERAAKEYAQLLPSMRWNTTFLYEFGYSLHKSGEYLESNEIMREALGKSSDAMILNIMGKNYQALGQYEESEACFIRSAHRVPSRMYPKFLLFQLYSSPEAYDRVKRQATAQSILTMPVKRESGATREMIDEVRRATESDSR